MALDVQARSYVPVQRGLISTQEHALKPGAPYGHVLTYFFLVFWCVCGGGFESETFHVYRGGV